LLPEVEKTNNISGSAKQSSRTGEKWYDPTSRGYFRKAGSNRLLQYLWNHIVSNGRKMSNGVE
jgi:hypothetical protein